MSNADVRAWLHFIDALQLDEDTALRLFCLPVVLRGSLGLASTIIARASATSAALARAVVDRDAQAHQLSPCSSPNLPLP